MELISKITNLENLFKLNPSTDFSYSSYIFVFVIFLFIWSYVFDYYVKTLAVNNKLLHKSLRGNMWIYRWVFTSSALVMLISRLESIPILSMKFLWIVYWFSFTCYSVFLIKRVKKNYLGRAKNKERASVWNDDNSKYLPSKSKKRKGK